MSSFQVIPAAVADASARLASISGHVRDAHGRLQGCSGAGAGTPAAGAMESLLVQWAAVLPAFADSAQTLTDAVAAAARSYAGTDAGVAAQAGGEGDEP